ncbi:MAG: type III-B CRISPR module-associated protein Cmr5 [Candidatus Woesearchaeota archaeon]
MKKQIEEMIPRAIDVANKIIANKDGKISNQFNGYISSFGAAVITSGLIPAVAFFTAEKSRAEEEREKIPIALYYIALKKSEQPNCDNSKILLNELLKNKSNIESFKNKIIDASIALKLAIRTFKLVEKDSKG